MKILSISSRWIMLTLVLAAFGFSSCNKDKEEDIQPQAFEDVRDYAVGQYAYTLVWKDVSSGTAVDVEGMDPITGTVELKKSTASPRTIELYEDGELFLVFDDVYETTEGFSFNHSWMMLPYEGEEYSFFAYDSFPMDGDQEAGVYYRESKELNFAWFVEIGNTDFTLTFESEKIQ